MPLRRWWIQTLLSCALLAATAARAQSDPGGGWPTYGGDPGGQRFAPLSQITRSNVQQLRPAWTFHTHALDGRRAGYRSAAFEATPVLFNGSLLFSTPFDVVYALDPATGQERWHFDPDIGHVSEGGLITSRGVATWQASSPTAGQGCQRRVFVATLNGRLAAIDADNGSPCRNFGIDGQVHLRDGVEYKEQYEGYSLTSPPTVVGDVVVVGSSIADNYAVDMPRGTVRGFDVRTGRQLWAWDPIPWALQQAVHTGAANAWSVLAADPALGLIYVPTGSASPDYYGGMRPGDDRNADSVVALEAGTGKKVWAFQTVHHNLWDYDVAAEPLLFTFRGSTPAIAIATKAGMLFVLDRRTGLPLYPVEERPVPQSDVPGEHTSPTQPFSSLPAFAPQTVAEAERDANTDGWRRSEANAAFCRERLGALRDGGLYTPPSLRGSVEFPGPLGGVNWGSAAFDPTSGILYANNNRLPFAIRLVARASLTGAGASRQQRAKNALHALWMEVLWLHAPLPWVVAGLLVLLAGALVRRSPVPAAGSLVVALLLMGVGYVLHRHYRATEDAAVHATFGHEEGPNLRAPYLTVREPLTDHDGLPCTPPPFGALTAIDLNTGRKVFAVTHGSAVEGHAVGSVSLGGPLVTAGGLLFTAATREPLLRAYDAGDGRELWRGQLPVAAQSTPMSYSAGGRQYVVIAAGGHGSFGTSQGDSLVAFSLP